jgi:hypothetical protein
MNRRGHANRKRRGEAHSAPQTIAGDRGSTAASRWIACAAGVFLLFQLLLPLRYYLSANSSDERFAWRMFSSTGQKECLATLYQTFDRSGRRVEEQVPPLVIAPWQKLLDKNRPDVVEKIMRGYFNRPGVVSVRYKRECVEVDGTKMPPLQLVLDSRDGRVREVESSAP